MILLVRIQFLPPEEGGRKTPVTSGYRPDWVSSRKPQYNCARLLLPDDAPELLAGKPKLVVLEPAEPLLWQVEKRDELKAMEGQRHVATATVLRIYR